MRVRRLAEVILYVRDITAQTAFYRDRLGLEQTYPDLEVDLATEDWVTLDAGGLSLALHSGGAGEIGGDGPALVFAVDDLNATHALLVSEGVTLQDIEEPQPGLRLAYGTDPEGFAFTLEQTEDGAFS